MKKQGKADNLVICVPSGNFGNITAGLFGKRMGLPVKRFIAANNRNDIFYHILEDGCLYAASFGSDHCQCHGCGRPQQLRRILDLYGGSHEAISGEISGETYTDEQIRETVQKAYEETGYLLDPHGRCGYRALAEGLKPG